jgi:hypothetical protein
VVNRLLVRSKDDNDSQSHSDRLSPALTRAGQNHAWHGVGLEGHAESSLFQQENNWRNSVIDVSGLSSSMTPGRNEKTLAVVFLFGSDTLTYEHKLVSGM